MIHEHKVSRSRSNSLELLDEPDDNSESKGPHTLPRDIAVPHSEEADVLTDLQPHRVINNYLVGTHRTNEDERMDKLFSDAIYILLLSSK